jgi:chlorobactene glucosyltransferase
VELLLSCAWLAIVASLIARAVGQRGLLPRLSPAPPPSAAQAPHVAAIVPARDEEANIGPCLQRLLAQDYPTHRLRLIAVDDHSTDATGAIVGALAARHPQLRLMRAPPLPPRWVGKSHACWIAACAAPPDVEWLCFVDADVRLAPGALASAVRAAAAESLDLLSLAPRQELHSFAERLMLPCGLILLSLVQDLRRAQARSGNEVTATGQFMLVRRAGYEAVGGHAAVHTAICEDLELARRLKHAGRAVLLMDGEALASARMYSGWKTLWPGFAKNLVDTFGGPAATLSIALAAVILAWAVYAVPLIDLAALIRAAPAAAPALAVALAASAAAIGLHVAAAVYFRLPFWYGLVFPLGYTAGALMALDSVRRRLRGRVSWKGRIYS